MTRLSLEPNLEGFAVLFIAYCSGVSVCYESSRRYLEIRPPRANSRFDNTSPVLVRLGKAVLQQSRAWGRNGPANSYAGWCYHQTPRNTRTDIPNQALHADTHITFIAFPRNSARRKTNTMRTSQLVSLCPSIASFALAADPDSNLKRDPCRRLVLVYPGSSHATNRD